MPHRGKASRCEPWLSSDSVADSDKQKGLRFSIAGLFSVGFCEAQI